MSQLNKTRIGYAEEPLFVHGPVRVLYSAGKRVDVVVPASGAAQLPLAKGSKGDRKRGEQR